MPTPQTVVKNAAPALVKAAASRLNVLAPGKETLLKGLYRTDFAAELAADQVIHLAEGWRYFSAALQAYLNHSEGAAIHQAYYAELRAVLSLFSGTGIQINDDDNFYLDSAGLRNDFRGHTHKIVWKLWDEWVKVAYADDLVSKNIKLMPGVALGDMRPALGAALSKQVLENWGYDLLKLSDDHLARNKKSYQAYWKAAPLTQMNAEKVEFVRGLWSLILPVSSNELGFDSGYVKYLVLKVQEGMFAGNVAGFGATRWLYRFTSGLSRQCGVEQKVLWSALKQAPDDFKIFKYAGEQHIEAENVLSRALFLLRIATLAVQDNFVVASGGVSPSAFWLERWLEHAGLWRDAGSVSRFDASEDYLDAVMGITPGTILPETIWNPSNAFYSYKLSRADACLVWGATVS